MSYSYRHSPYSINQGARKNRNKPKNVICIMYIYFSLLPWLSFSSPVSWLFVVHEQKIFSEFAACLRRHTHSIYSQQIDILKCKSLAKLRCESFERARIFLTAPSIVAPFGFGEVFRWPAYTRTARSYLFKFQFKTKQPHTDTNGPLDEVFEWVNVVDGEIAFHFAEFSSQHVFKISLFQ